MQRTLANTYQCPQCGSIDVTIQSFGMPTESFWRYMEAYEALTKAISNHEAWFSGGPSFDGSLDDDEAFHEWFCPEEGRGFYAPGNRYVNHGCIVFEVDPPEGRCTCRSCDFNFDDLIDDDELDDEDYDDEEHGEAVDDLSATDDVSSH